MDFISSRPMDYLTSRGYQVTLFKSHVFLQKGAWGERFHSIQRAYLFVRAQRQAA